MVNFGQDDDIPDTFFTFKRALTHHVHRGWCFYPIRLCHCWNFKESNSLCCFFCRWINAYWLLSICEVFSFFFFLAMHRDSCPLDCKVYVGNLGNNGNKTELERAFGYYGPLRSVWVARNPPGFAFVEFEDPRDAADAVRELDGR